MSSRRCERSPRQPAAEPADFTDVGGESPKRFVSRAQQAQIAAAQELSAKSRYDSRVCNALSRSPMPLSSSTPDDGTEPTLAAILRTSQLRALETRHAAEPLMERAGLAAAEVARSMVADRSGPVVVLAGPGNNGGDAFVAARWLRTWFHEVVVGFRRDAQRLPPAAIGAHGAYLSAGGTTTTDLPNTAASLIVDGLFGIGLRRAPAPPYAELIEWANTNAAPVLALDIPSALDAETGTAFQLAIDADATATFLALKP